MRKLIRSTVALAAAVALGLILLSPPAQATPAAPSGFLALSGAEAQRSSVPADARLVRSFGLEAYGLTYERYQQYYGPLDAEVLGGEITVYRDASGVSRLVSGAHYPNIAPTNTVAISAAAARLVAVLDIGSAGTHQADLLIDPESGRYFYRVESRGFASRWFHWVDAADGHVLRRYDALEDDHGTGVKGDTKDLNGPDNTATADDLTTFGVTGQHWDLISNDNRQKTYDAHNTPNCCFYATDADNHWTLTTSDAESPDQRALVDAQYYANVTDDYYLSRHGLDWVNDCHYSAMQSVPHYKHNYNNSFWEGTYVVYGDGDGTNFLAFSGGLDIVAHEHTHGVTECTSNLIYQNQSGALNEAFSDMMGNSAEWFANEPLSSNCVRASGQSICADWWVSEDVDVMSDAKPGFRNMADPEEDGDPDHYTEFVVTAQDSGGVHTNSGIPNHAYYLLVNGGLNASCANPSTHNAAHCSDADTQDNNLDVTGVGLADAQRIFFIGFTGLPSNATFCNARTGTENAATALFGLGSQQRRSTTDAWVAVGLTNTACGIPDADGDGVSNALDNCPTVPNPGQENNVHPATAIGDACEDPEPDGVFDISDNCPDTANPGQENFDGDALGDACDPDDDNDGYPDVSDGCPFTATVWPTPLGDDDCDGFTTTAENFLGTDAARACSATGLFSGTPGGGANDEAIDAWPTDNNDNQLTSLADVLAYNPVFNTFAPGPPYEVRFDLNADNKITIQDILTFNPYFNKTCTP